MMAVLGRELLSHEQVHHIDHNKLNNAPDNLMLTSNGAHQKLHATTFRNDTHKECTRCHEIKPRWLFRRATGQKAINPDSHRPDCRVCEMLHQQEMRAQGKWRR
jgi:hypothetical protein